MGLRDAFRKAAELVVELPEDQQATKSKSGSTMEGAEQAFQELEQLAQKTRQQPAGGRQPGPTRVKTVDQIVREAEGPNLDEIKNPGGPPPSSTIKPDGAPDFAAIYQQAALPAVQFSCEQMLGMIDGLPKEIPIATKRQMVKVSLDAMGKALGATPETVVADASRKLAALSAFIDSLTRQTEEFVSSTQMEIATLEAQISEKTKAIESARQKVKQAAAACDSEADRLDDVLEFFSLDVPPSKYAPPAEPPKK